MTQTLLVPDALYDHRGNAAAGPVLVDDGRITATGAAAARAAKDAAVVPLPGKVLSPSFTNAHSHAFQRALRGRVELKGHEADDFWTWRQAMYACANAIDARQMEALATWAYLDMVRAGFGSVVEFHYVHDATGADSAAMSAALARAAQRVGIRLTLLQTAYQRAGADKPATPAQRRFVFDTPAAFFAHVARAEAAAQNENADVVTGLALHSVRALDRDFLRAVSDHARDRGALLHMHACEQEAELLACQREHGITPLLLLDELGALTDRSTVVHATHIDDDDVALLAERKAGVCLAPSTERNLGDGLCPIASLWRAGVPLSIGTDQHARIDALDELRGIEEQERLRLMRRAVLGDVGQTLAQSLWPIGVEHGAGAAGRAVCRLLPGDAADLVALRVPLEGRARPAATLDALLVAGTTHDVTDLWVGGARVLCDGRVEGEDAIEQAALDVLRALPA